MISWYGGHFEFHVANGIFWISCPEGVFMLILVLVPQCERLFH